MITPYYNLGKMQLRPLAFLAAGLLVAQDAPAPSAAPPVLENTGQPMVLPVRWTEEDIHWAGLTCTEDDPCPIYLELTNVHSSADNLFAAGNLHSASVTMYSVLLASADGGRSWREAHDRIRGAGL